LTKSCNADVIADLALTGFQNDERLYDLPTLFVGRADHRTIGHRLMQQQGAFDLRAADVVTRRHDHVVGTSLIVKYPSLSMR
jgi:hypothetical protein